jgi:hypothetical protein
MTSPSSPRPAPAPRGSSHPRHRTHGSFMVWGGGGVWVWPSLGWEVAIKHWTLDSAMPQQGVGKGSWRSGWGALKVPKCEIFHLFDFNDFYGVKSL